MNPKIAATLLFYPVRILTGQPILEYFKYVKQTENYDKKRMKETQWTLLKKALYKAFKDIPYYRYLFLKHGINLDSIKCSSDLYKIPFLTKEIIQKNKKLFINPSIRNTYYRTTSGSTGTPLQFYKDGHSLACMDAIMYNAYSWHKIEIGDKQARFWGMPNDYKNKRIASFKDFIMNRKRLSAFDLDGESLERFYHEIKRFKPAYFYGYPSLIAEFASFVNERDKDIGFLSLKGIVTTGEVLLNTHRKVIEETFNTGIINEYGCSETGIIALSCEKSQMHLMSANIYLEVVKDGKNVINDEGEIVITELHSKTFPFIRYKLNDVGKILSKECSCGRNSPVIEISRGRIDSYIIKPSGEKVYDAILAYTLKEGIESFRALQTDKNKIKIYIKTTKEYSNKLKSSYKKKLLQKLGKEFEIEFIRVDHLPRDHSGKLRYFVPLY